MSFKDYEKHHLHHYVYSKSEVEYIKTNLEYQMPSIIASNVNSKLSETLFWESYHNAQCLYKMDKALASEVTYNNSTRLVTNLYDQSLKENHAEQTTSANQPVLCTKAEKINYRYFLKFDGTKRMLSNINLNPAQGQQDVVNIFIVYRLNSYTGSNGVKNGLLGHDDGGWNKFVCFSSHKSLIVSGTTNNYIVVGSTANSGINPIAPYKIKANAGELNKWCCLSIHWNVAAGNNASKIWCNGKKLCDFTSRSTTGSNQMTFGDLNPNGVAGLKGDISFFCLYKGDVIPEQTIKLHHLVLCRWFDIDHDAITF